MSADTSEPPQELAWPISYQVFGSGVYNRDFKRSGVLVIRPDGPRYIFRGKKRALFPGAMSEVEFGPEEIWNVVAAGRRVTFFTKSGATGGEPRPFVFYCANARDAATVAGLLPGHQDQDFTATRDFFTRLNALAGGRRPWESSTNVIIALNVLVYVAMGCLGAGWFSVDDLMPYIKYGANNGAATTDGEWWRLLTSMFLHYGAMHLLLNMWALFQAGHFLEKLQGQLLYLLTYLGSGIAGGFASIAWHGDKTWSVGASGAIFGVYGAIMGYLLREKQGLPAGIFKPMMKSTLAFAAYNILYGLRAGVDNSAHVGGVLGGLALGWLLALPVDREVRREQAGRKLWLGVTAIGALVVAGVTLTPRFDYSVRDEISWGNANREFGEKENDLLQHHQKALTAISQGADGSDHAAWMEKELVPFYESWDHAIGALPLAPGRLTARRREAFSRIFHERIDNYRHLIAGLRGHDAAALSDYLRTETKIVGEIEQLQKRVP